ncbi:unnamed protein product [Caenorhabditis auriculariae]|uniref:Uncharacterized protein n=1 Tax=Caenorhabditis auriculariae TaxID=2777116 RepID=A0A8S1HUX1_9PELO|nr:unnamed protein product [Caenorhabditis auriculariae]
MHKTTTHYTTPPIASRRLRARPYARWKNFDELFLGCLWGLSSHKVSILNLLSSGDHALVRQISQSFQGEEPSYFGNSSFVGNLDDKGRATYRLVSGNSVEYFCVTPAFFDTLFLHFIS